MAVVNRITDSADREQEHHDDWLHQWLDTIAENTRLKGENERLRAGLEHITTISARATAPKEATTQPN